MSKLAAAVKALSASLAEACPTAQVQSLTSDSSGTVTIKAQDAEERQVVINLCFLDPDEYPRSGLLVQVDEDASKVPSSVVSRLAATSERFQDGANLGAVLVKVCGVLEIPVEEGVLRAAEKQAAGGDAGGGPGSAMEDDASDDDPMSEDYPTAGSDDDDDDGGFDADDDAEEKELLVECGQRQGRWNRYEEDLAAANATEKALSMEQGKASKQQIFSSQEAFKMLSNELLGFIRRQYLGHDLNVSADSAGDDLYTWNVELWRTAFKPDCQLAKDMEVVSSKFASSSVQLRFTFMRGLHPFYPPRLEVVRPHLTQPLPGALSSHPLLRLEHWDPMMNMSQLVDNIRLFLQEHGSIDVSDPRNSAAEYPSSAFSPVEVALARLEAMTDVKPACYSQYRHLYEARSTQGRPLESSEDVSSPQAQQQAKKARTTAGPADAAAGATPAAAAAVGAAPAAAAAGGAVGAAAAATAAAAAAAKAGVVWAKGVGYGYGGGYRAAGSSGPVWDPKATAAAQDAQDEQINSVLQALAAALRQEFPTSSSSTGDGDGGEEDGEVGAAGDGDSAAAAAAGPSSSRQKRRPQQQQQQQQPMDTSPVLTASQEKCLAALHSSVLRPLLAQDLSQVSFTEMVDRQQYYKPLLDIVQALCQPAFDSFLAGNAHGAAAAADGNASTPAAAGSSKAGASSSSSAAAAAGGGGGGGRAVSIAGSLRGLQKGAGLVKRQLTKALEEQQGAAGSSSGKVLDKQAEELKRQAQLTLQVADQLLAITDKLQHLTTAEDAAAQAATQPAAAAQQPAAATAAPALPARRTTRAAAAAAAAGGARAAAAPAAAAAPPAAAAAAAAPQDAASKAAAYVAALKPHVLDMASISAFHKFKSEAASDAAGFKARTQKVANEMAGIERLIEVNESSSIFVRVDEDNTFLWRALITGPEDTPYSGGCFLFDFFFPANYPAVPPKVLITTTGGGTVRFNPNLYNCGKVCLSLLGTWSGNQGETWNAQVSTAFQVLVSIQSLILVPDPYFNEPGYEQRADMSQSKAYNKVIREATIKWAMLDQLQHPPAEFAPVIKAHFKLRGPYILAQIGTWVDEAEGDLGHKGRLQALKSQLEAELKKLD